MAEVAFEILDNLIEGTIHRAGPLSQGDTTSLLTINNGNAEVTVHLHGTAGGALVAIRGALVGDVFDTVDDVYGEPMSYSALGVIKSVGPALNYVQGVVTGGSGSTEVYLDVYVVQKVR